MIRKIILYGALMALFQCGFTQDYCTGNRFENPVFTNNQIDIQTDIVYGHAINIDGIDQDLTMDLYYPALDEDNLDKRPAIMYVHGGGLTGGSKESDGATDLGMLFAEHGFVFVSIEYRLGWDSGDPDSCQGNISDYYRAQYWGVQDTKAAFRYLKEFAGTYAIDTNYIFGSGTSAGSNLILYASYANQDNFHQDLYAEYGSIDSSTNNYFNHSFDIKGLILESAGLEDTIIFHYKDIPTIYFHGTCDAIIPFFNGPMFFCYEPVLYPLFFGAWDQTQVLARLGHPYHFYIGEGGAHDVAFPDTIIEYARYFLKDILCNTLETTTIYRIVGRGRCAVENNGDLFIEPIYPNPVGTAVEITVTSTRDRDVDLTIYNSLGETVDAKVLSFYPPIESYSIDVSLLTHGIYFMVVSQRQETYMIKFVK